MAELIEYWIEQDTPDGLWRSSVSFKGRDLQAVRQNVIAGFLSGQPRRAVDLEGKILFGLDARGKVSNG